MKSTSLESARQSLQATLDLWKESVKALTAKSGLVLLFGTLQTTKRTIMTLITQFHWLLILDAIVTTWFSATPLYYQARPFLGMPAPLTVEMMGSATAMLIYLITKLLVCMALVFSARASLEKKDYSYFALIREKAWGFTVLYMILVAVFYVFPLPWMAAFFYVDTDGGRERVVDSMIRGAKACWFFLPVTFLLWMSECIIDCVASGFIGLFEYVGLAYLVVGLIKSAVYFAGLALLLSATSCWYLKIKHSHRSLFFNS